MEKKFTKKEIKDSIENHQGLFKGISDFYDKKFEEVKKASRKNLYVGGAVGVTIAVLLPKIYIFLIKIIPKISIFIP